jgi:lysophospholipase
VKKHALVCFTLLAACHSDPHYPKQPALDLASLPGPDPTAFSSEADLLSRRAMLEGQRATNRDGQLDGIAGCTLRYRVLGDAGRDAVVVVPGRTEPAAKYLELEADLYAQGYTVYTLDHRGQGASDRLLADPEKGYVEFFSDYVDDLDRFVENVVLRDAPPHVFVLAHSMGGAVAVLYADAHGERISAMALSAPMLEINPGGFGSAGAATLGFTDCSVSDGTSYVPGAGPFDDTETFATNDVTHSEARWTLAHDLLDAEPQLRVGGATYRWVCESLRAAAKGAGDGHRSNVPTVLFQDGEDTLVLPDAQNGYCDDAARCQITQFGGAHHEILQESDAVRNEALSEAVKLFRHSVE